MPSLSPVQGRGDKREDLDRRDKRGTKEFQGSALINARGQFRPERLLHVLEPLVWGHPRVIRDLGHLWPGRPWTSAPPSALQEPQWGLSSCQGERSCVQTPEVASTKLQEWSYKHEAACFICPAEYVGNTSWRNKYKKQVKFFSRYVYTKLIENRNLYEKEDPTFPVKLRFLAASGYF